MFFCEVYMKILRTPFSEKPPVAASERFDKSKQKNSKKTNSLELLFK